MKQTSRAVTTPIGRRATLKSPPAFHISTGTSGLPVESPVEIEINGVPRATLLCTPEAIEELAVGWSFSHGFIDAISDLATVKIKGGRVSIMLNRSLPGGHDWSGQLTAGFDAGLVRSPVLRALTPPERDQFVVPGSMILRTTDNLFEQFRDAKAANGSHFCGLHDYGNAAAMFFSDFSRHNAVDKLIGWAVLTKLTLAQSVMVLSGRISGDIVYKAMRGGIKIIVTRALPSAQAIRLAQGGGITLIGRALDSERTIYTHPWRIDRNN
jgi:FdhD protein